MLGRSVEQQTNYDNFRNTVLKVEWQSVSDLILCSKFGMDFVLNAEKRKAAVKPFAEAFLSPQTLLLPNDFPYFFKADVKHFILWKINGEVEDVDVEASMAQLHSMHRILDSCVYINPPHLKSILDIEHAHIVFQVAAADNGNGGYTSSSDKKSEGKEDEKEKV